MRRGSAAASTPGSRAASDDRCVLPAGPDVLHDRVDNALYYRYLTPDGYVVGCTAFTLPTSGIDWRTVRGMTWVDGKIVYGSTDGSLRTVAFDPAAATRSTARRPPCWRAGTAAATWNNSDPVLRHFVTQSGPPTFPAGQRRPAGNGRRCTDEHD